MPTPRHLIAQLSAAALIAGGGMLAAAPAASATSVDTTASAIVSEQASLFGHVAIDAPDTGVQTISSLLLTLGLGCADTGVTVDVAVEVTNNTNSTIVLSANGSATITLAPGASTVDLSALGSGSLLISLA